MAKRKPRIEQAEIVRHFGVRLREIRQSRGMTQAELADKAQVTTSHIWKLESGGAAPGIDLVERFAKALGTTIADLLPEGPTPDTIAVLREQANRHFETIVESGNRDILLVLNPFLATLVEALKRRP